MGCLYHFHCFRRGRVHCFNLWLINSILSASTHINQNAHLASAAEKMYCRQTWCIVPGFVLSCLGTNRAKVNLKMRDYCGRERWPIRLVLWSLFSETAEASGPMAQWSRLSQIKCCLGMPYSFCFLYCCSAAEKMYWRQTWWIVLGFVLSCLGTNQAEVNLKMGDYGARDWIRWPYWLGQLIVGLNHYADHVTVNEHGRAPLYWFYEAYSQRQQKPLVLWFSGLEFHRYNAALVYHKARLERMQSKERAASSGENK